MAKPIQTGRVSEPLANMLDLRGRFGPSLDEILAPVIIGADARELPYTPRGWFAGGESQAAVAGEYSGIYLLPTNPITGYAIKITRIRIWNIGGAAARFQLYKDAGPVAAVTRQVFFTDWRRSADIDQASPVVTGLAVVAWHNAALPAGGPLDNLIIPPSGWVDLTTPYVLDAGYTGQPLIVSGGAVNTAVSAHFQGELVPITPPLDTRTVPG